MKNSPKLTLTEDVNKTIKYFEKYKGQEKYFVILSLKYSGIILTKIHDNEAIFRVVIFGDNERVISKLNNIYYKILPQKKQMNIESISDSIFWDYYPISYAKKYHRNYSLNIDNNSRLSSFRRFSMNIIKDIRITNSFFSSQRKSDFKNINHLLTKLSNFCKSIKTFQKSKKNNNSDLNPFLKVFVCIFKDKEKDKLEIDSEFLAYLNNISEKLFANVMRLFILFIINPDLYQILSYREIKMIFSKDIAHFKYEMLKDLEKYSNIISDVVKGYHNINSLKQKIEEMKQIQIFLLSIIHLLGAFIMEKEELYISEMNHRLKDYFYLTNYYKDFLCCLEIFLGFIIKINFLYLHDMKYRDFPSV